MNNQNTYQETFNLYLINRDFKWFFLLSILAASLSHFFTIDVAAKNGYVDVVLIIFLTIIPYAIAICWPFSLGTMLKTQFAHPRATLFPHFRRIHIHVAALMYVVYLILMYICRNNMLLIFDYISISTIEFMVIIGVFSIFIVWFTYLYHKMSWDWIWVIWLIWYFSKDSIGSLGWELLLTMAGIAVPLLVLGLGWRLMNLKEGMYEYSHVFSGKSEDLFKRHWKQRQSFLKFNEKLTNLFHYKSKSINIKSYPRTSHLWLRALHWKNYVFGSARFSWWFGLMFAIIMILFHFIFSIEGREVSYIYFFLIFMPPMMAWNQLMSWGQEKNSHSMLGTDLLKPLRRQCFISEIGMATLIRTWEYWFAIFVGMEIIRLMIVAPHLLLSEKLWSMAMLTFCLQLPILGLMASISYFTSKQHIISFIFYPLCFVCIYFIITMGIKFEVYTSLIFSLWFMLGGLLLMRIAHRLWSLADFN